MDSEGKVVELAKRLNGIAILGSDITESDISGVDLESLVAYVIDYFNEKQKPAVLNRELVANIIKSGKKEELPLQIEVVQSPGFSPLAKELESNYSLRNVNADKTDASIGDFAAHFNDRLERLRSMIVTGRNSRTFGMVNSISSLGSYVNGREICVVGMVYEKSITKNGHVLVTIEDDTGEAKVLFPTGNAKEKNSTFIEANKIVHDEVIAIRGKLAEGGQVPFIIANSIVYPDVPIRQRRQSEDDVAIAFMSDIHVGSRLFLEKQFSKFLEWINGNIDYRKDLASKIKYISIAGDLVDGIGVYPNQDKELNIDDIYKQYAVLLDLLSSVPDYIHIFMMPGNHDAVQRAEPQPFLPEQLIKEAKLSNLHLLSNPGYATIEGLKLLAYHGTSLDSVIQGIPGCSYSKPETAMVEVLKRRHLSPLYGDNPIVPSKRDNMIIDEVPDILHMGHLHKNGVAEYHGTLVVNSGTWQARTSYQVKNGHIPTPALLPVYQTKSMILDQVDFNGFVV